MASIGDHFVDVLIDAGIEFVFGMPGGGTPALWDGLVDMKAGLPAWPTPTAD